MKGLACADPVARTPIIASGNFPIVITTVLSGGKPQGEGNPWLGRKVKHPFEVNQVALTLLFLIFYFKFSFILSFVDTMHEVF